MKLQRIAASAMILALVLSFAPAADSAEIGWTEHVITSTYYPDPIQMKVMDMNEMISSSHTTPS